MMDDQNDCRMVTWMMVGNDDGWKATEYKWKELGAKVWRLKQLFCAWWSYGPHSFLYMC